MNSRINSIVKRYCELNPQYSQLPEVKSQLDQLVSKSFYDILIKDYELKSEILDVLMTLHKIYKNRYRFADNYSYDISLKIIPQMKQVTYDKIIEFSSDTVNYVSDFITKYKDIVINYTYHNNFHPYETLLIRGKDSTHKEYEIHSRLFSLAELLLFHYDELETRYDINKIITGYILESVHNKLFKELTKLFESQDCRINDLFKQTLNPFENRDIYDNLQRFILEGYTVSDIVQYAKDICDLYSVHGRYNDINLEKLFSFSIYSRLRELYLLDYKSFRKNLSLLIKYSDLIDFDNLIKPYHLSNDVLDKHDRVLSVLIQLEKRDYSIDFNSISFNYSNSIKDYYRYHDIAFDYLRRYKLNEPKLKDIDFELHKPIEYISTYKKISVCDYEYQWGELLGCLPSQIAESFSPLYLGGIESFQKFKKIYFNYYKYRAYTIGYYTTDYSQNIETAIILGLTLLDIDPDNIEKVIESNSGSLLIHLVKLANDYSSKLGYPTRDRIRRFQKTMKYLKRYINLYNNNSTKFLDKSLLNSIEDFLSTVIDFELKHNRLPSSLSELNDYIINQRYKDVPKELINHLVHLKILDVQEYSDYWKEYLKKASFKTTLPNVDLIYKNYRFRLVDKRDPLQLFLGDYTDCCQTLNNVASSCIQYGMYSENSGFYVIEKDNQIYAQAWTWRIDNILVFDSFEAVTTSPSENVIELIQRSFNYILQNTDIDEIRIGDCNFGITRSIIKSLNMEFCTPIKLSDYNGYTDSEKQRIYRTSFESKK